MALKKKPVTGMKDMMPSEMEVRDYVIGLCKSKELTAAQAQKRLGLSHATFYRMLNSSAKV